MIEIPESTVLAEQINETLSGKRIKNVIAAASPHKFAWYHGDPQEYHDLLVGKVLGRATGYGALVEIKVQEAVILLGDGVSLRFIAENEKRPEKHQLLIEFDDLSALAASIQMYGGIWCYKDGEFQNTYFLQAKEKPLPLSQRFDRVYFDSIINAPKTQNLSVKALIATEQRIPGLGNGVLQDILLNAGVHPKKKIKIFTSADKDKLYDSIKSTLSEMTLQGGRDTEKDLFGRYGGYKTRLSKNTVEKPCQFCGTIIKKETYMGGSIYYCASCQKLL